MYTERFTIIKHQTLHKCDMYNSVIFAHDTTLYMYIHVHYYLSHVCLCVCVAVRIAIRRVFDVMGSEIGLTNSQMYVLRSKINKLMKDINPTESEELISKPKWSQTIFFIHVCM